MKNKVLFLVQLPPPVHGASLVNQTLFNSLVINQKYFCRFINISPAKKISELGKFSLGKFISSIQIIFRCTFQFLKFKPHLVYMTLSPHGIAFYKDGIIAVLLRAFGANLVFHMHGKGITETVRSNRIKLLIYRYVFKNVDVIHLASRLLDDISGVVSENARLYVLPNGVDIEENSCSNGKLLPQNNKLQFIYLSNLIPTKGIDTLVSAINLLDSNLVQCLHFHIVGGTKDEDFNTAIKSNVGELWRNSVTFYGPLYGLEKNNVLELSDVFVLPTRFKNECFPLSILEAMSKGLAVISTYEGAIPDIIEPNVNGFLVDATDVKELSNKIAMYANMPSLAKEHGLNGLTKFMNSYTIKHFEGNFCEIIDDILAKYL